MPDLDNVASDIVTHQRETVLQRKDLAQKTKDFRKLEDAHKLSEVKGLLKGTVCFGCYFLIFVDEVLQHINLSLTSSPISRSLPRPLFCRFTQLYRKLPTLTRY